MRRSTVPSLPLQLVFLAAAYLKGINLLLKGKGYNPGLTRKQ
jgi:hypothetical protein